MSADTDPYRQMSKLQVNLRPQGTSDLIQEGVYWGLEGGLQGCNAFVAGAGSRVSRAWSTVPHVALSPNTVATQNVYRLA